MKKIISFAVLALVTITTTFGQEDNPGKKGPIGSGTSTTTTIGEFDKVVIGDKRGNSNLHKLHVYSNKLDEPLAILSGNRSGFWQFATAGGNGDFAPMAKKGTGVIRRLTNHDMIFHMPNNNMVDPNPIYDTSNYNSRGITSISFSDMVNHHSLVIFNTGKVTMGTPKYDNDSNYRLYVKDGIKTERIKVEVASQNGWADYVFDNDYQLMPLQDVESFVKINKHLPEIPSAAEVVENGVELKAMNVLLLKKVEELTLHLIALNKEVNTLKEKANNNNN